VEISLSLSEFMSITAESTIESHPLSPQQQTLFAMCKVNRRPSYQSHMTFQGLNTLEIILYSI
jgi:hypothetical protein